jgi:4-hydroxy-2-oxoglutarate aldolase
VVAALANIAGGKLYEILEYFRAGNLPEASVIQQSLIEVNSAVTTRFGVPGLKAAMDMLGFYGGPARAPLLSLTDEERESLRQIVEKAKLNR